MPRRVSGLAPDTIRHAPTGLLCRCGGELVDVFDGGGWVELACGRCGRRAGAD